jgi:hypothetical protein
MWCVRPSWSVHPILPRTAVHQLIRAASAGGATSKLANDRSRENAYFVEYNQQQLEKLKASPSGASIDEASEKARLRKILDPMRKHLDPQACEQLKVALLLWKHDYDVQINL